MQRWPKLTLRKGDALAQTHANTVTANIIKTYFALVEKTLMSNDLVIHANRVYNMDQSGSPLDLKPSMVVTLRGTKKVHCRTFGNILQIASLCQSIS